jgi:hypothetical protein
MEYNYGAEYYMQDYGDWCVEQMDEAEFNKKFEEFKKLNKIYE